jgi:hypothetical protein
MAERYYTQLNMNYGIEGFDLSGAASTITKAVEIISCDIEDFFDYTIAGVRQVIAKI